MPSEQIQELLAAMDAEVESILNREWTLGADARGHGAYNWAVLVAEDKTVVVEKVDRKLCEHLIALHNASLETEPVPESDPVREALERAERALLDWMVQYAPEQHTGKAVMEAGKRVLAEGGTLAYIADVLKQAREALEGGEY
jgi:hypothetical protein